MVKGGFAARRDAEPAMSEVLAKASPGQAGPVTRLSVADYAEVRSVRETALGEGLGLGGRQQLCASRISQQQPFGGR